MNHPANDLNRLLAQFPIVISLHDECGMVRSVAAGHCLVKVAEVLSKESWLRAMHEKGWVAIQWACGWPADSYPQREEVPA